MTATVYARSIRLWTGAAINCAGLGVLLLRLF
jgi:hypothetical protein